MDIITADIQYKPQQEIVRDVSMFQTTASKGKSKKKNKDKEAKTYEEYERAMLIEGCKRAERDYLASFGNSSASMMQTARAHVPNMIINILVDRGTVVSLLLANEYIENNYTLPDK